MNTNSDIGMVNPPNLQNVQQINPTAKQQANLEEMKRKEKRFQTFGVGSFLYALFYTFCLYHNTSGITYPFSQAERSCFLATLSKSQRAAPQTTIKNRRKRILTIFF